jgi:membrane protein YdbS with pleckstrin-like domain
MTDPDSDGDIEERGPRTKSLLDISRERRRQPRGDTSSLSNALLRAAVVLLCSVNAVMWEVYTEAPVMATLWAAVAVGFVIWMIYDARHR